MAGSFAMQFKQRIGKAIGTRVKEKILDIMDSAAREMLHEVTNTRQFHDVTGNLLNSIAVGIYYERKLVEIVDSDTISRKSPTRRSLAKGESYDMDTYYSGIPAIHTTSKGAKTRPFTGKVGSGGQDGVSAARNSLYQRKPDKKYAFIVVAPMQYARYVENLKSHNVLSALRDEMPYIFESKIIQI